MTIKARVSIAVQATMELNESELAALDALAGYGTDGFLEVFYAKMGRAYLQPHEAGLRSLFDKIRADVPNTLRLLQDARKDHRAGLEARMARVKGMS